MVNEAIILAAGEGSGFWPVTNQLPKTLIEVMNEPLLYHQLGWLCRWRIERAIIALQAKHLEAFMRRIEKGVPYPIDIIVSVDKEPPGSAGSVHSALKYVRNDSFLVLNCDDITNIDIEDLSKMPPPVICIAPYRLRFGVVVTEGDRVLSFNEKPVLPYYTNCGWYLMSKSVSFPERGSFEYDLLPELARQGVLRAYRHEGMWWTVNTWREKYQMEKEWENKGPRW